MRRKNEVSNRIEHQRYKQLTILNRDEAIAAPDGSMISGSNSARAANH